MFGLKCSVDATWLTTGSMLRCRQVAVLGRIRVPGWHAGKRRRAVHARLPACPPPSQQPTHLAVCSEKKVQGSSSSSPSSCRPGTCGISRACATGTRLLRTNEGQRGPTSLPTHPAARMMAAKPQRRVHVHGKTAGRNRWPLPAGPRTCSPGNVAYTRDRCASAVCFTCVTNWCRSRPAR